MKSIKLLFFIFVTSLLVWTLSSHAEENDHHEGHSHQESSPTYKKNVDDGQHAHPEKGEHQHDEEKQHDEDKHADEHGSEKEGHHAGEDHHEEGQGHEEASGSVGPGKAIEEANEETGIRLSDKALKRLKIKTTPAPKTSSSYPASALVKYQEETGVYRLRKGVFKLVPLDSNVIQPGDEIVISGAALLRAAELDAFGGEVGHAH